MFTPVCFITSEGTGTLCSSEEINFVFSLLLAQFPSSHIHQHRQANYAKKIFPLIFGMLSRLPFMMTLVWIYYLLHPRECHVHLIAFPL